MQRRVEVDFADVQSLSSANLGGLIQVNREARGLGADLVLTNVGDPVRDIFKLTRLDRMFTFANSTLGSDSICQ